MSTTDTICVFRTEDKVNPSSIKLVNTRTIPNNDKIYLTTFLNDNIAIGCWNKLRIFNHSLSKETYFLEYAHQGNVTGISPCGHGNNVIATVGHDGIVKLWSLKNNNSNSVNTIDSLDMLFGGTNNETTI